MPSKEIVAVSNLTKKFGKLTAVDNISFSIKKGEIFGFLGPNGAGKTTTINMLSTLLRPTSGDAIINGTSILSDKDRIRRDIGIVFQIPALDDQLTGRENLDFHARLYNLDKDERKRKIRWALRLVELEDKADILVRNYSGGMRRRLEIARGLIHKPEVLFLDEPTLGLDAQTRRKVWEYIRHLNKKEGLTVLLTTHYMEEADNLCDRVAIIDHGRIIVNDTPGNLKKIIGGDIVTVKVSRRIDKLTEGLKKFKWVKNIKVKNKMLIITMSDAEKNVPKLFLLSNKLGIDIKSLNVKEPTLEDVFLHFTGRSIREEKAPLMMARRFMRR